MKKIDSDDTILDNSEQESKSGWIKLLTLILFFAIILLFRTFVIERVIVDGVSMYSTFYNGDVCWATKYNVDEVERYDIVVAVADGQRVIKRVIGMPDDTIIIKNHTVYINGEKVDDKYDFYTEQSGIAEQELKLQDNEYFLMGDNRDESYDSRNYGCVEFNDIKGIVVYRLFPFDRMGFVDNFVLDTSVDTSDFIEGD